MIAMSITYDAQVESNQQLSSCRSPFLAISFCCATRAAWPCTWCCKTNWSLTLLVGLLFDSELQLMLLSCDEFVISAHNTFRTLPLHVVAWTSVATLVMHVFALILLATVHPAALTITAEASFISLSLHLQRQYFNNGVFPSQIAITFNDCRKCATHLFLWLTPSWSRCACCFVSLFDLVSCHLRIFTAISAPITFIITITHAPGMSVLHVACHCQQDPQSSAGRPSRSDQH